MLETSCKGFLTPQRWVPTSVVWESGKWGDHKEASEEVPGPLENFSAVL